MPPSAEELLAHADWLTRLARALVGDAGAADLVQDTFEVALTRPPEREGPLGPWLAGVLRNVARMRARGGARRAAREEAAPVHAEAPTPEELIARVETQQLVARIVLELEEPLRSTLLLRYYEGLSAADIARAQGVPAGTVRWRLKEAVDRVRARLDSRHGGDRRRWALALAPLTQAAPPSGGLAPLAGGILVKTTVKVTAILAVLLALAVGTRLLGWWGGGDSTDAPVAKATDRQAPGPTPAASGPAPAHAPAPEPARDADPRGSLRLEGQVIDEADQPVGGARVAIDANPPIVVESERDGSFVFEGLIARDYRLEANRGDGYAGPARLRLTPDAQPVILRMRKGGVVEVVVGEAGGAPVGGAQVELRSTLTWSARTGADGVAVLRGVGPGWSPLVARADGFAPAATMLGTTGDPAAPQRVALTLARGAAIAGRVVDEAGAPIAGARVVATAASEPFPVIDARRDGVATAADGTFRIPAASAGTWRVTATHTDHAPATSPPLVVDGKTAREGIELALGAGGAVRGVVRDASGQPVAAADVRVVGAGHVEWRSRRQAFTGADGRFAITGLPARAVEVVAWHPSGASAIVPADLVAKREHEVVLTLDLRGAIEGVVVDAAGEPVGDAQVIADPVHGGTPADRAIWSVRGVQEAVTDPDGRFRFAGLPDGAYDVRAARPGASEAAMWLVEGTRARPGDPPLRIVVERDGRIVGRVAFADGKAPRAFTVDLGTHPVPFASADGSFAIAAPRGTHALAIAGPGFVEKRVRDASVKAGEDLDLGTITVTPGRSVSGRVLDDSGAPVAGAQVAAGGLLSGDGAELYIESESVGAKDTLTDDAGRFSIEGFGPLPITVVAGKDGVGRSASLRLPRGNDSAVIDLVLQPTTGVEGKVTRNGAPLADTIVIANPGGATSSNFFTTTGPDGSFALDAIAPGHYVIQAMLGGGGNRPKDLWVRTFEAVAGKRASAAIDIRPGDVTLTVVVKADDGSAVPMAMVFAIEAEIEAEIDVPNIEALRDATRLPFLGDRPLPLYTRTAMGGTVEIAQMRAAKHTVCAVPVAGRPEDPELLPMKCAPVAIGAAPARQTVEIVVPAAWLKQ